MVNYLSIFVSPVCVTCLSKTPCSHLAPPSRPMEASGSGVRGQRRRWGAASLTSGGHPSQPLPAGPHEAAAARVTCVTGGVSGSFLGPQTGSSRSQNLSAFLCRACFPMFNPAVFRLFVLSLGISDRPAHITTSISSGC